LSRFNRKKIFADFVKNNVASNEGKRLNNGNDVQNEQIRNQVINNPEINRNLNNQNSIIQAQNV
jgi:hypothetical protein